MRNSSQRTASAWLAALFCLAAAWTSTAATQPSVCIGDIIINEFAAATSDRLIRWSDDSRPSIGMGLPWTDRFFNDEGWDEGTGGFGYGGVGEATTVNINGSYSAYLRRTFSVTAADAVRGEGLYLDIDYEDGFVAYLNGVEIARQGLEAPGGFSYHDQIANNDLRSAGSVVTFHLGTASNLLVAGQNVLAVHVHTRGTYNARWCMAADLRLDALPSTNFVRYNDKWTYFVGTSEPPGGLRRPEVPPPLLPERELVSHDAFWRYYVGTNEPAGTSSTAWTTLDFDDTTWPQGRGGLGYGDGDDATIVTMQNIAVSLYIRQAFVADEEQVSVGEQLELSAIYDDGFVAYLNGQELARANVGSPGEFAAYDRTADGNHEASQIETYVVGPLTNFLHAGTNILAVQVHNQAASSSDLSIIADLGVVYGDVQGYAAEDIPEELDWIELYNRGSQTVNLNGWSLTDDPDVPDKYVLPPIKLPSNSYLTVIASGTPTYPVDGSSPHTNFRLSSSGEYLALFDNGNPRTVRCAFEPAFPPQSYFNSYGNIGSGNLYAYMWPATPGQPNAPREVKGEMLPPPEIEPRQGFYSGGIIVTMRTATVGAEIRYTLNGKEPTPDTGYSYAGPLSVPTTTVIRARAFAPGAMRSKTVSRTYLVDLPDVFKTLPALVWAGDEERDLFEPHGIMAISGGYSNWWPATEIDHYNNGLPAGRAYERPVAAGLIYPDDNSGFEIDCGYRVEGRAGRSTRRRGPVWNTQTYKYGLRLYFRSSYGEELLEYPLFADTPVEAFDQICVRSGFWDDNQNPALKDELLRRLLLDCGQLASHGIHANLFINGAFKAYYNVIERPKQLFFQSYNHSTSNWEIFKLSNYDGDRTAFNALNSYVDSSPTNAAQDYAVYLEMARRLDLTNFVDYLLVNVYAGNGDWPGNNWILAREHRDGAVFRFLPWDSGCSFGFSGDTSRNVFDKLDLPDQSGPAAKYYYFLKASPEFRLFFADRIQRHLFNNGALVDANVMKRYLELKGPMQPIVTHVQGSFRNNVQDDWVPNRRPVMFAHCTQQGLWPGLVAPEFSTHGGAIDATFTLAMTHTNGAGTIYYTTDGSDPRAPGGAVAGVGYGSPVALDHSAVVKARVEHGGEWSPLSEAVFSCTNDYGALQVSEIMYNPVGGEEYEFIEFKNTGTKPLVLADMVFSNGLDFSFPREAVVGTGEYVVLCAAPWAFAERYPGVPAQGAYLQSLANNGERVTLCDNSAIPVLSVSYDDAWYPQTDGEGYSLVRKSFDGDPDDPASWRGSAYLYGSPGAPDPDPPAINVVFNEILSHADPPLEDAIELHNLTTSAAAIGGWYLSDSGTDLQKYRIPDGTVISPTGFVVFYEYQFNSDTNDPLSFGVSSHGETLHLSSPEIVPSYHVSQKFGASANGVSFARHIMSTGAAVFVAQEALSLGSDVVASDPPARSNDFRAGKGAPNVYPLVGPVLISEIMYHPLDGGDEFVELYNSGDTPVPLYDPLVTTNLWRLEDDTASMYEFPTGTEIEPHSYLVVVGEGVSPALFRATYSVPADVPVLGPCTRSLGNGSDSVRLFRPDNPDFEFVPYILVEDVDYDDDPPWPTTPDGDGPSLQRLNSTVFGNDPASWIPGPVGGTPGRPVPEPVGWVVASAVLWMSARRRV